MLVGNYPARCIRGVFSFLKKREKYFFIIMINNFNHLTTMVKPFVVHVVQMV